jgi:alkaline phosphatase
LKNRISAAPICVLLSGLESNRLLPVVIILSIGLFGSLFLYYDATSAGEELPFNPGLVDDLVQELEEANQEINQLEITNNELGERVETLESEPLVVIVENPELILDVSGEGDVKNVILFIGDGMGVGQLTAAEVMNGDEDLVLTRLPFKSLVTTHSSSNFVTDSAASATALATGHKTRNGKVSVTADGEDIFTVLEDAEELGKATGIVTTARVTHATPACFVSHVDNRDKETTIAEQLLESGVDVALGGGSTYFTGLSPETEGYTVVYDSTELENIESGKVLGLFTPGYMNYETDRSESEPSLSEMTTKSLELLSTDPEGFFLMVESGRIDHASHDHHFDNTIAEMLEFDLAVLEALEYAAGRDDTLVIVTADHETGGLSIVGGYPSGGGMQINWVTDGHVGGMVPVYAYGPRASETITFDDNTDIGVFLLSVIE